MSRQPSALRTAYESAEAARISLAAELATARHELRRERALRAHPALDNGDLIDLVHGDSDDAYAVHADRLATALLAALGA